MRFILQDDVCCCLPSDWKKIVEEAERFVEGKVTAAKDEAESKGKTGSELNVICLEARHKAINLKSSVWSAAKEALREASHDKCWYCETKQDRSDMSVDHFRPKNSVIEEDTHPGYTWLAFDWKNFRLSCTFCNCRRRDIGGTEGGKQDHFPIIPPPSYAHSKSDPCERSKLLDPVNVDDTKLLTFLPDGSPHPAKSDQMTIDRVEASIELYHLKQIALVRKRKQLAIDIEEHVLKGDDAKAGGNESNYLYHKKELIKKVRAQAEFSTAARLYLRAYRDRLWVKELLDRDL